MKNDQKLAEQITAMKKAAKKAKSERRLLQDERDVAEHRLDSLTRMEVASLRAKRKAKELVDGPDADEPIRLHTIAELRKRPPVGWLVDRFAQRSTIVMVAGPPGIGKSFLTADLALSVATGQPFLGERPTRQGRVLYIAGEGATGLPSRVEAWERTRNVRVDDDALMVAEQGVDFSSETSTDKLVAIVAAQRFDLVIADTFSQLTRLRNENDAAEVATALRNAQRVREACPGSVVVFVHHVGKGDRAQMRGSSAIQGNVDTVWIVKGDSQSFDLSTLAKDDGKAKDFPRELIVGLKLEEAGDSCVITMGPTTLDLTEDPLAAFERGRDYTVDEIAELKNLTRRSAERAAKQLVESGRMERPSRGLYRVKLPPPAVAE